MSASPEENELFVRTATAPDGRALVEVRDTGVGIPADVLPRVFEPFFTTKGPGGGTGLGLSICHQIVSACGGEIMVESVEGKGTTMRVLLPASTIAAVASVPPPPSPALPREATRRGRVLVVDDEIRFARSVRWLLEPEHEVDVTSDGEEALALIARGPAFDVILCDLQMPGLSGMDIHAKLAADAPHEAQKMVFVSGGAVTAQAKEFVRAAKNRVLDKPFRPEALCALVAEVIGSKAGDANRLVTQEHVPLEVPVNDDRPG
jgi:CheY-like chemotaxis protein